MLDKYLDLIKDYQNSNISLAGMTSLLIDKVDFKISYMELRKLIFKELQRLDSNQKHL